MPDKGFGRKNSVGFALMAVGRKQEAKAQFEKVIALDPKFAGPYNDLGSMALNEGRLEDAVAMFEKVLTLHPGGFSFARPNLGLAYQRRGDLKKAEEHLAIAAGQMVTPWVAAELARTRRWIELEPRLAKLRTGDDKFRDLADAFNVRDYCLQPFCHDRLLLIATCEWLIAQEMGRHAKGMPLRLEAARAALQQADILPADQQPAFRNQALQFLKDDLQSTAQAKDPGDRDAARRILSNWQNNGVAKKFRENVDQLPAAERSAWQTAWDELQRQIEQ